MFKFRASKGSRLFILFYFILFTKLFEPAEPRLDGKSPTEPFSLFDSIPGGEVAGAAAEPNLFAKFGKLFCRLGSLKRKN